MQEHATIYNISARGFAAMDNQYDIIVLGPSGASTGGSAGVYALSVSYDYTVEALRAYLKRLSPDGILSITMWTSNPAQGNLKLFATAVSAMQQNDIAAPEKNIAWIRSWNTATLLLKNNPLTAHEINQVRQFASSRNFDLAWLPDIRKEELNRFQLLQEPVFYLTASAILAQDSHFVDEYKYDIRAVTDNRPYFNNFFRWSSLQEMLSLPGQAGISMIGVGYPTLLATFSQAVIVSFILILLPLAFLKKDGTRADDKRLNIVIYFIAIGLAFLFIELAFIEKLTLILSQPLYAVAVTLCAFLVFSGLGSLYTEQQLKHAEAINTALLLKRAVILIGTITVLYILVLPRISGSIMALPEGWRIVTAFMLAAPLAFVMGMPFPLGLASVQQYNPGLMPWAWGINGCASVLSAILAVILAIHIGFNGVMLCAVALYFIAWSSRITASSTRVAG
jgi:hypothetical protein